MAVSGFLEILTTVLSWQLFSSIWGVLVSTGVAVIPFISIIWRNVRSARENRDKVDVGVVALRLSEIQIYLAIVVIVLCCQPLIVIATNDVVYTTYSCDAQGNSRANDELTLGDTDTGYDSLDSATIFNGDEVRVPIWWAFTNNLFRGITAEVIAAIPCNLDVQGARMTAENIGIKDPYLRSEAIQFGGQCWVPARNQFFREQPSLAGTEFEGEPDYINSDINWIGSHILRDATGYYASWQAQMPVKAFAYETDRDSGRQTPEYATHGYPLCDEWYDSLENRVLATESDSIDNNGFFFWLGTLTDDLGYTTDEKAFYHMLKGEDINNKAKAWLSSDFSHNQGIGVAATLQDAAAILGLDLLSAGHYTKARILRDGMPMAQALLMMMIVIILPMTLVFSEYSLKTVFLMTFVQFGVIFWSFLFALAYWLDNNLAAGLAQNDDAFMGLPWDKEDGLPYSILSYITAMFHILLPVIFTVIMGWAGASVGTGAANTFSAAAQSAADAGGKAADQVENMTTNIATSLATKKLK